ncbi:MAG TPA: LytTR family DNA-binding domain-containing protein [Steroidobacteraceae bacterium]|nr:LytTR family DNA-binding domain-containing protein [Steroidobacteraceae bacterium]
MSVIGAVIVDDMAPARAKLRRYLAEDRRVAVVGEAESCRQAALLIADQQPQIAFLDVRLPDGSGMDILARLATRANPIAIFVTAFDQYALRAFEVDARDYLLKPFARERFRLALNRAIELLSQRVGTQTLAKERRYLWQLCIKDRNGRRFISLDEIDVIDADDHYLRVRWGGRLHLIRGSLAALERELDPAHFMRVHRSAVVRLAGIRAIRQYNRGDYAVELRDGSSVPISRTYHREIRARFNLKRL